MPSVDQTLRSQNKLKTWYVLFWIFRYKYFCKKLYFGCCNFFIRKDLLESYLLEKIKSLVGYIKFVVGQKHDLVGHLILPRVFPVRQNVWCVFRLVGQILILVGHCLMSDCYFKTCLLWSGTSRPKYDHKGTSSGRWLPAGKKRYLSFLNKIFVFEKNSFKVKILKTFKIFSDRHIKTCQFLKRRAVLKILSIVFKKSRLLLVALKWKLLEKALSCVKTKINSNFPVNVYEML